MKHLSPNADVLYCAMTRNELEAQAAILNTMLETNNDPVILAVIEDHLHSVGLAMHWLPLD